MPTQYEGTMTDGRTFYFWYRFGRAELGFGRTELAAALEMIDDAATPYLPIGDRQDGELDEDQFKRAFVELLRRRTDGR